MELDTKDLRGMIRDVGPSYAVIFALLALLSYLAFAGVPAIMVLAKSIQANTDITAASSLKAEQNQATIISQHGQMIEQNTELIKTVQDQQRELDSENTRILKLEADEYSRSAKDTLHGR